MNELNEADLAKAIQGAVQRGDSASLNECIVQFSEDCFKECESTLPVFSEDVFRMILDLMTTREFLEMEESHKLLFLFESDWGRLNEGQKERLLPVLESAYVQFKDRMSMFVISELLGEYYCSDASFLALRRLRTTSNEIARAFVPHGFEHLARDAQDSALRQRAKDSLTSMESDSSPQVKQEVAVALSNLLEA